MKTLRRILVGLLVIVLLCVGGAGAFLATFDPNTLHPRVEAAMERLFRRDAKLNGAISVRYAWPLVVQVEDVSFANVDGGSRAQMITVQKMEAQVGVWPLLRGRIELHHVTLTAPDILLEVMSDGRNNWTRSAVSLVPLEQPHAAPAPRVQGPVVPNVERRDALVRNLEDVQIRNGRLTLHDMRSGYLREIDIPDLRLGRTMAGTVRINGADLNVQGQAGNIGAFLLRVSDAEPWPMDVTLALQDARLRLHGAIAEPRRLHGWQMAVDATLPSLSALAPLLPDTELPALHDVRLAAQITEHPGTGPDIASVQMQVGASDLSALFPGLHITRLDLSTPALGQPVQVALDARLHDAPVHVEGRVDAPAGQPARIDLTWRAADASGALQGEIANPVALAGVDLAISAQVPDLAALGTAARQDLPTAKDLRFSARLAERGAAFRGGAILREIKLDSPYGDLAGEIIAEIGRPSSINARLASNRLDLDALRALRRQAPVETTPPITAPAAPTTPAPTAEEAPLVFRWLSLLQGRFEYTADEVRFDNATYRQAVATAVLEDRVLRVQPMAITGPAGRMDLRASIDVRRDVPQVALAVKAPGVAVAPLVQILGYTSPISGNADVDMDLRSAGLTRRAILTALSGRVAVALENGRIQNRVLGDTAGSLMRSLGSSIDSTGSSGLACLAMRVRVEKGVAQTQILLLDTDLATLDASGAFNLPQETLALRVQVAMKTGLVRVNAPVMVSGPWRSLRVGTDRETAAAALGSVLNPLDGLLNGTGTHSCTQALAIARGTTPPPEAAPVEEPPRRVRTRDLLRGLFE